MDVEGHACHEHDVLVTGAGQQTRPKKKKLGKKNKKKVQHFFFNLKNKIKNFNKKYVLTFNYI